MKKLISLFAIYFLSINCSKKDGELPQYPVQPQNANELFTSVNIDWNQTYQWREYFVVNGSKNYKETGKYGTIKFLQPNLVIETYSGNTTQSTFDFKMGSLTSPDWHNKPESYIINQVLNEGLFKENNETFYRWGRSYSGEVYSYKVVLSK
jgi:hypothetical protein